MILESTPFDIVLQTLHSEREKTLFFQRKMVARLKPEMLRYDCFSAVYTHPESKNKYLFWCGPITTKTRFQRIGNSNFRSGMCLLVETAKGERMVYSYAHKNIPGEGVVDTIMVFTAHFFQRYRERFGIGPEVSAEELICIFLNRNSEAMPLDYDIIAKYHPRPDGAAMQGHDGLILGEEKEYRPDGRHFFVVRYNTFISTAMLKDDQAAEWMTEEKYHAKLREYAKDILREHPIFSQWMK